MGNDAVGFARKEACGLEGNDLRRQIDHNFDYVTCCGRAVVTFSISLFIWRYYFKRGKFHHLHIQNVHLLSLLQAKLNPNMYSSDDALNGYNIVRLV